MDLVSGTRQIPRVRSSEKARLFCTPAEIETWKRELERERESTAGAAREIVTGRRRDNVGRGVVPGSCTSPGSPR